MEENQTLVVNPVETPTTPETEQVIENPAQQEKTYTKEQVERLMKRRVERSHKAFFTRYGVDNLEGLDAAFKQNDTMKTDYEALKTQNAELARKVAFLENNVNPEKYEDVIAHFKGTGIEFSEEQLVELLKTHPEWLKQPEEPVKQIPIKKLGSEAHGKPRVDEKEKASQLLGVKL